MPSNGSACSLGVRERSERCIPCGALEQTWPGQRPKGIPIACQALIKIVLHVNPVTAIRTAAGHLHKLHKLPKISATERGSEREREGDVPENAPKWTSCRLPGSKCHPDDNATLQ